MGAPQCSAYQLVGPRRCDVVGRGDTTLRRVRVGQRGTTVTLSVAATNMHGTGTAATVDAVAGPTGYYMLGAHGALYGFGELGTGVPISNPSQDSGIGPSSAAVDIDLTPFGTGYWITHENGRVFAANNSLRDMQQPDPSELRRSRRCTARCTAACSCGPASGSRASSPTRTGLGYWIFTSFGACVPVRRRAGASVISPA